MRSRIPRVLVLSSMFPHPSDPTNGIFVKRQIEAVKGSGFDIRVIRPIPFIPEKASPYLHNERWKGYGEMPQKQQIDGIDIYYLRYVVLPFTWFHPLSSFTQFWSLCKRIPNILSEFQPNIFHSYNVTPEGYAGLLISHKYKWKHICGLRGSDINLYPFQNRLNLKLTQEVLRKSDQILSVSHALKKKALAIAEPMAEIKVVYNGCDLSMFFRKETSGFLIRKTLGIPENSKCIIYVGHLKMRKGIFDLIEILKRLSKKNYPIYLIIIGDGGDRKSMEREIGQSSLKERILLMGSLTQEVISDFLSAADLFVLPTYQEGLPNVLLEAMACQLPIVTSRVGGIPEIVSDGINGLLVEPGEIEGFCQAIELLLKDEILRSKMGKEGLKTIQKQFLWQKSAEELGNIYKNILS
jgi:teichuronic acid biosynthesis glycosyltransferase TuaC